MLQIPVKAVHCNCTARRVAVKMPKPRSKRQAIREERKAKRRDNEDAEASHSAKRQRLDADGNANHTSKDAAPQDDLTAFQEAARAAAPEKEFYGMLSEQEQEYFRSVDEQLDLDDFPSQEDRDIYLANVFAEAEGKELKLACSQSCSRLMERLILMSNTRQKKKIFAQLASHFLNLLQHRFASHCCETLFLQSAPVVTRELSGERDDFPTEDEPEAQPLPTMEEIFLATLDELEGHLGYLLTDKFASHSLRVILIILSGRPLEQSSTKSLVHSKKKERISVPWTSNGTDDGNLNVQLRAVPSSFTLAAKKIIDDSTAGMDSTALRVLATHPTGNPVLQLLLELDISLDAKAEGDSKDMALLWRLLPGAPGSLKEPSSPAHEFVNSMLYDSIGSRLLETLLTHCPGKVFKALWRFNLGDRIQSLVRNDIACYPAIRMLNRVGKEELVASVHKILPEVPKLVSLSRYNVLKALFERCQVREAKEEINSLMNALVKAINPDKKKLVPKLCIPPEEEKEAKKGQESMLKSQSVILSHGCHLTTTLLSIPGAPASAIQTSLQALPPDLLLYLATSSAPSAHVLMGAFASPAQNKVFHKAVVAALVPKTMELALSPSGSQVLNAIVTIPSRAEGISLPFHLKEQILTRLSEHEQELRDSFEGRRVWRAWKGDLWKTRRTEWIEWAKEVDAQSDAVLPPWKKKAMAAAQSNNPNMVKVDDKKRKRAVESMEE